MGALMLHWSKSRHVAFQSCPRNFFYSRIAAPRNPKIGALENEPSPPLIRQDVVRRTIRDLLSGTDAPRDRLDAFLGDIDQELSSMIDAEVEAKTQFLIVEKCLSNFANIVFPEIEQLPRLYVTDGNPVEFTYHEFTIWALPEVVLDRGESIDIISWRTGKADFRNHNEGWLKAGGLTCWARSELKEHQRPVVVTDIYLRDLSKFTNSFTDSELRQFVAQAKDTALSYSASARIRDFPAQPSLSTCYFCSFKSICPEYKAFSEEDYDLTTLGVSLEDAKIDRAAALTEVQGEYRSLFLSHVSEDTEDIVRPFARALEAKGITFWLDEAELTWGDSLSQGMSRGLAISEYVVCFLSERFLERGWPTAELGSAIAAQNSSGKKRLLPLFVSDTASVVAAFPLLADIKYVEWSAGSDEIIAEIRRIIG